jgi:predicted NodU family carbamoyl transferase
MPIAPAHRCGRTVSGRLQTVSQRTNSLYYSVIDTFRELTGVPMMLNTHSENEPVVCEDMLVMGQAVWHRADSKPIAA